MFKRFLFLSAFLVSMANASDEIYGFCLGIMDAVRDNLGVPPLEVVNDIADNAKEKGFSRDSISRQIMYCEEGMNLYTPYMEKLDETLGLIYDRLEGGGEL